METTLTFLFDSFLYFRVLITIQSILVGATRLFLILRLCCKYWISSTRDMKNIVLLICSIKKQSFHQLSLRNTDNTLLAAFGVWMDAWMGHEHPALMPSARPAPFNSAPAGRTLILSSNQQDLFGSEQSKTGRPGVVSSCSYTYAQFSVVCSAVVGRDENRPNHF